MAMRLKLPEGVKRSLECSICAEVFHDPRALPCVHTFCLKCLQGQGSHSGKNPGDTMLCPICRKEYLIPEEGFLALPRNFKLAELVEGIHLSEAVEERSPCDASKASKLNGTTQMQLKECKVGHCHHHPENELEVYCHDCALLICRSCIDEDHHSHNCRTAEKTVEEIQQVIDYEINKMSEYITEVFTRKEQLKKRKKEFLKEIEKMETIIINRDQRDDQTQHSLKELAEKKHHRLKEMDIEKDEFERHHARLESFKANLTALRSQETTSNVLTVKFKDMLKQASELRQLCESWASSSAVSDLTAYGDKNTTTSDSANYSTSVVLFTSVRLTGQLKLPMCIAGVTKLQNDVIYVLRHASQSSSIRVYKDQSPIQWQTEILLEGVGLAHDIAASNESQCLYISDKDKKCLWKMTIADCHLSKWLQHVGDPFTMSLSFDDLLVIPRCGQPARIEVYARNAALVHRIQLASEIEDIRHAVETPTRSFIVIAQCTERTSSTAQQASRWTVCEVTRDGDAVRVFEAADEAQQLSNPHHLSLDLSDGVLVADYGNHTVVQFDSDLKWRQILLSTYKDSLVKPVRLFFDQKKRQLLVGQRGGTVSMYTV